MTALFLEDSLSRAISQSPRGAALAVCLQVIDGSTVFTKSPPTRWVGGVSPRRGQEVLGGLREGLQVCIGRDARCFWVKCCLVRTERVDMMANHSAILADDHQRDVVEPDSLVHSVLMLGEPTLW